MLNNESLAKTAADSITKAEDMQVCQHNSKSGVSCRLQELSLFSYSCFLFNKNGRKDQ